MLVVSDTTPVNYLILIGEIDVLAHLFEKVVLPQAVVSELSHVRAPEAVRRWIEDPPVWIEIREADTNRFPSLDPGESAALGLPIDLGVPLLADEAAARTLAKEHGVPTIGTLGLLAEAHLNRLLDFDEAVAKLRQTNVRIHESLIENVRRRIAAEGQN